MISLEQASYVAQIIGGAAVVASLVYVAFELRQNTAQLLRNEANAALGQNSAFRLALANDREVAQVWIQGHNDPSVLPAADRLRFELLLAEQVWINFHLWERSRLGLSEKGQWSRGPQRFLVDMLSTRGGGAWWAHYGERFPPPFVAAIDAELAAVKKAPAAQP